MGNKKERVIEIKEERERKRIQRDRYSYIDLWSHYSNLSKRYLIRQQRTFKIYLGSKLLEYLNNV